MIETEQMQQPVRREHEQFVARRMPCLFGLALGNLRAQNDIAEQACGARAVFRPWAQLVHGKAQHIGRPGFVHPLNV